MQVNPILRDCSAQSKRRGKPLNMQNVYLPFSPIIHLHFYFLCFKSLLWQFSQLTLERQLQQWNNLFLNLFGWDCALEFLKLSIYHSHSIGAGFKHQIKSNELKIASNFLSLKYFLVLCPIKVELFICSSHH